MTTIVNTAPVAARDSVDSGLMVGRDRQEYLDAVAAGPEPVVDRDGEPKEYCSECQRFVAPEDIVEDGVCSFCYGNMTNFYEPEPDAARSAMCERFLGGLDDGRVTGNRSRPSPGRDREYEPDLEEALREDLGPCGW